MSDLDYKHLLKRVIESTPKKEIVEDRFKLPKAEIFYEGKEIHAIPTKNYYKNVQGIFQDPYSSFNYFYRITENTRILKKN